MNENYNTACISSKVIRGSELNLIEVPTPFSFGASISNGLDVDGNGHPGMCACMCVVHVLCVHGCHLKRLFYVAYEHLVYIKHEFF